MAFQNAEAIQKLYVAFFNRPADYYGLQYWDEVITKSGNADAVIASLAATFAQSKEYTDTYAGQNTRQIINNIYKNLFGRPAEEAGLEYWNAEVTAGRVTLSNAVLMISGGAQNADKIAYASKVTAATSFTNALDTTDERLGYAGEKANAVAKQFISTVTDAATLATAIAPTNLDAVVNQSIGAGTTAQTYNLTKGLDVLTGTSGDDMFVGAIDENNPELSTASALDNLNGGAGFDTLMLSTSVAEVDLPNLSGIETITVQATNGIELNTTSIADVTTLNVTRAGGDVALEAAASTKVNVTAKMNAGDDVFVSGGSDVAVKLSDVASASDIIIGSIEGGTAPTGSVVVNVAGKKAANGDEVEMGDIVVGGGKTINVTQAVGASTSLVAGDAAATHTQGDITIVAAATTTDVVVKQSVAATARAGAIAKAEVKEVVSAKFVGLEEGESVSITYTTAVLDDDGEPAVDEDGAPILDVSTLTFTAAKKLTAAQVAQAFANLKASTALGDYDTQGSQAVSNGVFSGSLAGWNSSAATGDTVTFTAEEAGTTGLTSTGAKSATLNITTAGDAGQSAIGARLGVVAGEVDITGGAALKTVTVDSYDTGSSILGAGNTALTDVSLANGKAFTIDSAATALNLKVASVNGKVTVAAGTTTLNVDVAAGTVTTNLASGTVKTLNVTGSGRVAGTAADLAAVTAISTTGMTGGRATFEIAAGTTTSYAGGAGSDRVTITDAGTAISKTIDLGAGDDTLTLGGNVVVPTVTLKGGEGTDTLLMTVASAAARDGTTAFAGKLSGFERLTLNDNVVENGTVINVENLGFNYITTKGAATNLLTIDKLANNGTVVLTAGATVGIQVNVKDAAEEGSDADVLNVVTSVDASNVTYGTLTADDVETININTVDATPTDADGNLTNTGILTLDADSVTSVKVTGNAHLNLTIGADTDALATIDGSAMTGDLSVGATGAVAVRITGGAGDDNLRASVGADAKKDVLIGGAGDDTLWVGSNGATLTGGDGADTFVVAYVGEGNGTKATNSYSVITDFKADDVVALGNYIADDADLDGDQSALVPVSGFAVLVTDLNDDTANLDSFIAAAMAQLAAGEGYTGGGAVTFNFGGNAYIVVDGGDPATVVDSAFNGGEDMVVRLTGIDATKLTYNSEFGTIALV